MIRKCLLPTLAACAFLVGPGASAQTPIYDIRAELAWVGSGPGAWVVQIRNVGPAIPGPFRSRFHLQIPAGAKITQWTLNGWQCTPALPQKGPAVFQCNIGLPGGWAAGTILSNQLFYTPGLGKGAGIVRPQACVRALLLLPDASGNYQPVAETNAANNSTCA
jgi:hypothetical protein